MPMSVVPNSHPRAEAVPAWRGWLRSAEQQGSCDVLPVRESTGRALRFVSIFRKYSTSEARCQEAKGPASCLVLVANANRGARQTAPNAMLPSLPAACFEPTTRFSVFLRVVGYMASTVFSAMLAPASNGKNSALMLDADPMPMRPHHTSSCAGEGDHRPCVPSSFEFSHHSGALRRLLKRVANPSPRSPDQQQRPPSYRDSISLSLPRTSPPSRSEPLWSPPTSLSSCGVWAVGATSPLPRPPPVADGSAFRMRFLAVQNSTGFVRLVIQISVSGYSQHLCVYKRPNQVQSIHWRRWTLTNLPVARNAMRLGTAGGFADNFEI